MVSVLIPTFNSEIFVVKAIESVLAQGYKNFEILILDDGSSDRTVEIVNHLNHPKIRLFESGTNRGLPAVLNEGIRHSKGAYLARLDSDDLCAPGRLEAQVNYLRNHPSVGLVGGSMMEFGEKRRQVSYPKKHDEIACAMLFRNAIAHGAVMYRAQVFREGIRYSEESLLAQDYELWSRLINVTEFANLEDVLMFRRVHEEQVTKSNRLERRERYFIIRKAMASSLGVPDHLLTGNLNHPVLWLFRLARWNYGTKRFRSRLFWAEASRFLLVELRENIAKAIRSLKI